MKLINWLKSLISQTRCEACGSIIDNGWIGAFHESECIDKTIGYVLYTEKITPETRVYFMNLKKEI